MGEIARDIEQQFNSVGGIGCYNCGNKKNCWRQSVSARDDTNKDCEEWTLSDSFEDS